MASLIDRFAQNMKRERARAGLSQSKLAQAAGVAPGYVSMLENGQRDPPLSTVEQIARGLGCTPAALLGFADPEAPAPRRGDLDLRAGLSSPSFA